MHQPGSLLLIGFAGNGPSTALEKLITRHRPGGLLFFERNIPDDRESLAAFNRWISDIYLALDEPSPILAIDHEGGRVHRLGTLATRFPLPGDLPPSARAEAGRIGHQQGRELFALGFNFLFGPVYDIAPENGTGALGRRTWADDALHATSRAEAVRSGIEQAGLLACPKHFPGYGQIASDPHQKLSRVTTPLDTWRHTDGFPFESAVHNGIHAIMTAHLVYETVDDELPASLSQEWRRILREDLGYSGVVIPDDLCMGALDSWSSDIGRLSALCLAGASDMALIGHPESTEAVAAAIQAIGDEAATNRSFRAALELSHFRVRTLRRCLTTASLNPDPRIFAEGQALLEEVTGGPLLPGMT